MANRYQIHMPQSARKRVVNRHENGRAGKVEYHVGRKVVGVRIFDESGTVEYEYCMKAGKRHEVRYDWEGELIFAEPFVNGMRHGVARQWDHRGRTVGTYRMVRGNGLDLWRQLRLKDKSPYLSEAVFWKDGLLDGFEWWINEDQWSVYIERHWRAGGLHGIHREWFGAKGLDRGFPKFYVHNVRVAKRAYLKASKTDASLPAYREEDDNPRREFPPRIARHLSFKARGLVAARRRSR